MNSERDVIEIAWAQAHLSRHIEIEVEHGRYIEEMPVMFARRSRTLSRRINGLESLPNLIDMNEVSQNTFGLFRIWAALPRPSLTIAHPRAMSLDLATALARLAHTYEVPALANEVCDVFRHQLTLDTRRQLERRAWTLDPTWVLQMYSSLQPTAGLIRLIEDAVRGLCGKDLSKAEKDAWEPVILQYPKFAVAYFREGGSRTDLTWIKTQDSCCYHDHDLQPTATSRWRDEDTTCPLLAEEWYPECMRKALKYDPFPKIEASEAEIAETLDTLDMTRVNPDEDIQFVEQPGLPEEDDWTPPTKSKKNKKR